MRTILLSIACSTRQLNAAAALDTSQMPKVAGSAKASLGHPGSASSMPITAQNTMSCTTRGLVSAMYCRQRVASVTGEVIEAVIVAVRFWWRADRQRQEKA